MFYFRSNFRIRSCFGPFIVPKFSISIVYVSNSVFVPEMNAKSIFVVMNTTWADVKTRPEKNSDLYGIWTHDFCDTGAVLYQRS